MTLAGCADAASEEESSDESNLSITELGRLVQLYDSVRARRAFTSEAEAKRVAEVPSVSEACAASDPICRDIAQAEGLEGYAARAAFADVRTALRERVVGALRAHDLGAATATPAVKYWLRERVVALTAQHAIQHEPATFLGGADGALTSAHVDAFLRTYYPLYTKPNDFALARAILPAETSPTCTSGETKGAVIVIPGVIRSTGKRELEGQIAAARAVLPCLDFHRVSFGSFDDPDTRIVPEVKKVFDRVDPSLPIHIVGYSQGVVVAMRTLARYLEIGARTRSVLAMNGAHHGSEAGDFALELMNGVGRCQPWQIVCKSLRSHAFKILTESLFHVSLSADEGSDRFEDFIARKKEGMTSLTTGYANAFWSGDARAIPTNAPDALFYSFRSTITKTDEDPNQGNLPREQVASFNLVWDRAQNPASPFNDMQVRLENHALGGPLASREVVSRVAEGNHWQWQLTEAETDRHMEREMIERTPRNALFVGYYDALAELGIVTGD